MTDQLPASLLAQAKILVPTTKTHGSDGHSTSRGGISSNVGLVDLRPEQREYAEQFERNMHETEETFKEATGFLGLRSGPLSVVGKNHVKSYEEVAAERAAGKNIEAVYYDTEADCWVLPDEYKSWWAAGYICQHCLGWQQIPHHSMCNTIHGGSCGIPNPFAAELDGLNVKHNLDA